MKLGTILLIFLLANQHFASTHIYTEIYFSTNKKKKKEHNTMGLIRAVETARFCSASTRSRRLGLIVY